MRRKTQARSDASQLATKPTEATPDSVKSLSSHLDLNTEAVTKAFLNCDDVIVHSFDIGRHKSAALIYVDGFVDKQRLEQDVLRPLMQLPEDQLLDFNITHIQQNALTVGATRTISTAEDVISFVVDGQVILLVDGLTEALLMSVGGPEHRAIEEPVTEGVIRGPREGFNENVWTSTSLIRRKIRTPNLKFETQQVGTYTRTLVVLGYIEGIITPEVVDEIRTRIQRIEIDGILESSYIEEMIEDNPFSPFPQLQNTERPDVVAAQLLEGRAVILVDGTPFALMAPINLWGALQSSEDYYERYWVATAIRWLRYIFILFALGLPALYVAILTYHPELLPTNLLLSIAASRESIPFPAVVECLIMEVTFEALREAGVRLPKTVGNAISIVGALVIGQAAVQAGLVSAPMVIVVAITGIASFTIPRYSFGISIRMLRFPLIILASFLGLFGIVVGVLAIGIHLASLKSMGIPYTAPFAPLSPSGIKDTIVRAPWWSMHKRPASMNKVNPQRQTRATLPKYRKPRKS